MSTPYDNVDRMRRRRLDSSLRRSAGALLVLSIGSLLLYVVLTTQLVAAAWRQAGFLAAMQSLAINGALVLASLLTLVGAVCMLRLRWYSVARAGAVLAALPFSTPLILLGLPFGIRALMLLWNPEVRAQFATRDSGEKTSAEL